MATVATQRPAAGSASERQSRQGQSRQGQSRQGQSRQGQSRQGQSGQQKPAATRSAPRGPRKVARQAPRAFPVVLAGLAWAVVLVAAAGAGPLAVAMVVAPVAGVACVTWNRAVTPRPRRRARPRSAPASPARRRVALAAATGVLAPVAALVGVVPAVAVLLLGGAASVLSVPPAVRWAWAGIRPTLAAVAPATGGTFLVLGAGQGRSYGLALIASVLAYDVAAFLMGNARTALGGPVGIAAGWVALGVTAVFVAAIMDPPFSGVRPWVVFAVLALSATGGVALCDRATLGIRLPAVRRLDSLFLAAPVWFVAVALLGR